MMDDVMNQLACTVISSDVTIGELAAAIEDLTRQHAATAAAIGLYGMNETTERMRDETQAKRARVRELLGLPVEESPAADDVESM